MFKTVVEVYVNYIVNFAVKCINSFTCMLYVCVLHVHIVPSFHGYYYACGAASYQRTPLLYMIMRTDVFGRTGVLIVEEDYCIHVDQNHQVFK